MKMPDKINETMIAPCGKNCLICDKYLSQKNTCPGCRAPTEKITRKSCKECAIKSCALKHNHKLCYKCTDYPCSLIIKLNKRYMKNYNIDLEENSNSASWNMTEFLKSQKEIFTCNSCFGIINQHYQTCSNCWKETNKLAPIIHDRKNKQYKYRLLEDKDFKNRKNLIKLLEAIYGNEHIFRYAMLKLLKEHENKATAFGLYFGYQKEPKNFKEIAEILNLSSTRVGVLCKAAYRRLTWFKFREIVWEEYGYTEKE
jgi:hypothetical protein